MAESRTASLHRLALLRQHAASVTHLPVGGRVREVDLEGGACAEDAHAADERQHARHELEAAHLNPARLGVGDDHHVAVLAGALEQRDDGVLEKFQLRLRLRRDNDRRVEAQLVLCQP